MRGLGLGYRDIAAELRRRYDLRPRAAWREASLVETANRINDFRGQVGLDPGGFAGMTASHLCEHENWPGYGSQPSGRRPTPYLLAVLAAVYDCAVTDLIDIADRERLPQADLLILDKYANRGQGSGQPVVQPARRSRRQSGDLHVPEMAPHEGLVPPWLGKARDGVPMAERNVDGWEAVASGGEASQWQMGEGAAGSAVRLSLQGLADHARTRSRSGPGSMR
jgi:hypothetical protein